MHNKGQHKLNHQINEAQKHTTTILKIREPREHITQIKDTQHYIDKETSTHKQKQWKDKCNNLKHTGKNKLKHKTHRNTT